MSPRRQRSGACTTTLAGLSGPEFESECVKCLAELEREIHNEKFTLAELDEEEQNVDRLRRWHRELRSRDLFDSVPIGETQRQLDACVTVLDRFTTFVYAAVGLD